MDLEMQLRAAEARRADLERQHGDALAALRGCGTDTLEARQSRVRELEKKVALETVRCEELQLELAASQRARGMVCVGGGGAGVVTTLTGAVGQSWGNKGTEIERIMAKIEQDNRILAELDHSRSTTLGAGLATSASSHALGECSPPLSPITMSHTTPSIYPTAVSSSLPPLSYNQGPPPSYLPPTNPVSSYNVPPPISQYNSLHHAPTYAPKPVIGGAIPHSTYVTTTYTNPLTTVTNNPPTFNNPTFGNPVTTSGLGQFGIGYNPVTTSYVNNVTFSNPLSSQFNSLGLGGTSMGIKLKQLDDVDLGTRRVATPVTPHPPTWGLGTTTLTGMTDTRPRMLTDGIDSDWSGLHAPTGTERNYLNGHNQEGQVDMLDIPGKGRCSVYIARFSYDPEPDAEEELPIAAGDYLLVWGEPVGGAAGAYLDAELLDGRRGLVPSHFVQRLVGDDLLEFHQAVLSTLREEELNQESFAADVQRLNEMAAEMADVHEQEQEAGPEVPAPRQLTLERQLNKSVLISWTSPEGVGPGNHIESYHVYVDGVLKATVKATERTRALVEGVESNRPHRISVRSVTANRRTSRDAACTMIIGRDTHQLGPSAVRATNITSTSAVISWLPANSNHQHVVCVNNVEVRCVKPGVYRHTITGLAPNTQYRVTVRAKHQRAGAAERGGASEREEVAVVPAAAHTDFRTLPKGLPDPPSEIMVEPGPQDGTLLVTWHPILTSHHPGSAITGYAVFADGKKVTDVDSPTGDHALIDISKLLGLNPKHVTVRTKARDSQSADSLPTAIPLSVLRGGGVRGGGVAVRQQPHSAVMPAHLRGTRQGQVGQQVIEPDENLSDKEIFPSGNSHRQQGGGIPSIEITKEAYESNFSEDELQDRRNQQQRTYQQQQQPQQQQQRPYRQNQQREQSQQQQQQQQQAQQQQQYYQQAQPGARQSNVRMQQQGVVVGGARGPAPGPAPSNVPPNPQKRARWFVALFDYDPSTMSPNPDACDEELPFSEGDTIKVWGDKDADGFYWGECRGRRGYVPHNMVMEVEGQQNRDRWGDIYANMPVKRMVALYDYDPQELSPNVDAEVELSFTTGQIINVYGEMDDDGFYMGEIDGVRGLVPSNFLTEAPEQYGAGQTSQGVAGGRGQRAMGGRGVGPGARGPPPPPRENTIRQRNKDACPVLPSQLDNAINTATPNTQVFTEHNQGRGRGTRGGNQSQQSQQQPGIIQQAFNSAFSQSNVGNASTGPSLFGQSTNQQQQQQRAKGVPQVVPNVMIGQPSHQSPIMQQGQQQQSQQQGPNLMQKLNEITAPGGDILSKGKELIFMKFGLGGK